jgi:hypothetical protein
MSPSSHSDRAYLFIGGPWDGRREKTGGVPAFRVPELDLEGQLRASIELLGGVTMELAPGPTAELSFKVAQYTLGRRVIAGNVIPFHDHLAYRFEGYE